MAIAASPSPSPRASASPLPSPRFAQGASVALFSAQCRASDESEDTDAPSLWSCPFAEKKLLVVCWSILFMRYVASTFLSSFFPEVCSDLGISGTMEGLIFAGYPAGIAVVSPFAPRAILRVGTRRSVLVGLATTSVFTVAFGFVPDMVSGADTKAGLWLLFYTLSGALGTLADTTCIVLLGDVFAANSGKVMAVSNTVMGVGCMAGPALGGPLHSLSRSAAWNFRAPFLIVGAMPAAAALLIVVDGGGPRAAFPQRRIDAAGADGGAAPLRQVITPTVALAALALFVSGMAVATLDPTLEYRLRPPLSESAVSGFFTGSSVVYALCCPAIGWLCDGRLAGNSAAFKLVQALGLALLACSFAVMGPWRLAGSELPAHAVWVAGAGMFIKGVGSAGNNAAYPDMVLDCGENKAQLAAIGGVWNAVYAVGWAAGPLAGGALYGAFGSGRAGFEGMATANALVCGAAAALLAASACCRRCNGGAQGPPRYAALPRGAGCAEQPSNDESLAGRATPSLGGISVPLSSSERQGGHAALAA